MTFRNRINTKMCIFYAKLTGWELLGCKKMLIFSIIMLQCITYGSKTPFWKRQSWIRDLIEGLLHMTVWKHKSINSNVPHFQQWMLGGYQRPYCKTSSISRTKLQNLNVSCILMQLSSLNSLKPGVKLIMKMLLEQRRQAMLQLHLSYQQFYCLLRCDLY